jgi:mono/diheme cytochrome c family protein
MSSNIVRTATVLTALSIAVLSGNALAQKKQKTDLGKLEYAANCATCHGEAGKGDGPLKPFLTKSPTDLTVLAKNNGGVMPVERMYAMIEGGGDASVHGTRDMPVWGHDYRVEAAEYYFDVPYDPEVYVRSRILALIDYIYRLQAK